MNARELVHVMNELAYGRGSRIPELRALGESLFAQCEQQLPFLAVRKPEAYRQSDGFCPRPVQLLTLNAPVTVLAAPQDAEGLICSAYQLARGYVPQPLTESEQTALLKSLLAQPRKRELEQVGYTLLFGGLSLAALTHLTRHRMQALCAPELLKAARYDRYVLPESVRQAGMEAQYRGAFRMAGEAAAQLRAAGAGEDALSYLLLSGQTVPVLTTMNAGELYVFFRLRCCNRAQWEIRGIARAMMELLNETEARPIFQGYGPSCAVTGRCPEGAMCCGRPVRILNGVWHEP